MKVGTCWGWCIGDSLALVTSECWASLNEAWLVVVRLHLAVVERRFLSGGYANRGTLALLPGLKIYPPRRSAHTGLHPSLDTAAAGARSSSCQEKGFEEVGHVSWACLCEDTCVLYVS